MVPMVWLYSFYPLDYGRSHLSCNFVEAVWAFPVEHFPLFLCSFITATHTLINHPIKLRHFITLKRKNSFSHTLARNRRSFLEFVLLFNSFCQIISRNKSCILGRKKLRGCKMRIDSSLWLMQKDDVNKS